MSIADRGTHKNERLNCQLKTNAECPTIPVSSGLSRFCLKIPNPDAITSVGIEKSRFWSPESYFRQINKETKYLTWIWGKVNVWTKKTANKNPLPSISGCIAFVQGLLRLVTSHAFWTSGKYQTWKQAWSKWRSIYRNFFDRNIYLRVLEMVFQGLQVANISGDPLAFSGFALVSRRGSPKVGHCKCNCQKKEEFPLPGNCLVSNIIYKYYNTWNIYIIS